MKFLKPKRYAGCPLRFLFDDLTWLKSYYLVDYRPDEMGRGLVIRKILTDYSKKAASHPEADRLKKILQNLAEKTFKEMLQEKNDFFQQQIQTEDFNRSRCPGQFDMEAHRIAFRFSGV